MQREWTIEQGAPILRALWETFNKVGVGVITAVISGVVVALVVRELEKERK